MGIESTLVVDNKSSGKVGNSFCVNSNFYKTLSDVEPAKLYEYSDEHQLSARDTIFIPAWVSNQWWLVTVSYTQKTVILYDPVQNPNYANISQEVVNNVAKFFKDIRKNSKKEKRKTGGKKFTLTVSTDKTTPPQTNGLSGIFVVRNILEQIHGKDIPRNADIRKSVAIQISNDISCIHHDVGSFHDLLELSNATITKL